MVDLVVAKLSIFMNDDTLLMFISVKWGLARRETKPMSLATKRTVTGIS